MRVFRFFFGRIFLRKPLLVLVLLTLIFATNYIVFAATRILVSTSEGASEVARFNSPGTFTANLVPESDVDHNGISDAGIDSVYERILGEYDFALFTDGYLADMPNARNVDVPFTYMNQKYSDLNGFKVASGNDLNFQYDLTESNEIPVLIGKGLADQYPLGTEISLVDPALGQKVQYTVIGILDRDPSHSNRYVLDSKQYYNFSVVIPVNDSFIQRAGFGFKTNALTELTLLGTTPPKIQELKDYIAETAHLPLNFDSPEEIGEFYNQYFRPSIIFLSVATVILLCAIVLLGVWSSLVSVRVLVREFTINLLVGMSYTRFRRLLVGYYSLLSSIALLAIFTMVSYSRRATWERKEAWHMTYGVIGGLMEMDWIALAACLLADCVLVLILSQCVASRIKRVPISVGVLQ